MHGVSLPLGSYPRTPWHMEGLRVNWTTCSTSRATMSCSTVLAWPEVQLDMINSLLELWPFPFASQSILLWKILFRRKLYFGCASISVFCLLSYNNYNFQLHELVLSKGGQRSLKLWHFCLHFRWGFLCMLCICKHFYLYTRLNF